MMPYNFRIYKDCILVVSWSLKLPKEFRAFCRSGYQSPILELSGYSLPNPYLWTVTYVSQRLFGTENPIVTNFIETN